MRNLRTLCAAFVLTLVLAAPALAGHIETPSPQPPSGTATAESGSANTNGYIETGITGSESLTEVAVSLLSSVLALL